MLKKNRSGESAAPNPVVTSTALVALAFGMGLTPSPAEATAITTAGQTGPGITVTQVNQQVSVTSPVTFGPAGGFTASLDTSNNLSITANAKNSVFDANSGSNQLNGLAFGDTIGGTAQGQGTEYNTVGLEGSTVYYGLETYQNSVNFDLTTFVAENQGWVEVSFEQPTIEQFAFDPIPEPSSLSLFAIGALAVLRRRRRKQPAAV